MAAAISAAVLGAKAKFEMPAGTGVSLANRAEHADLSRSKKHHGYEPQFPLMEALKDQVEWMRKHPG
jgi:nucleoside-diphosphate-sugar epimerase